MRYDPDRPAESFRAAIAKAEMNLTTLLNRYSRENGSNTPDYILAEHLVRCLDTWNATMAQRTAWYGRPSERPGATETTT
jgi:hypothetical protein